MIYDMPSGPTPALTASTALSDSRPFKLGRQQRRVLRLAAQQGWQCIWCKTKMEPPRPGQQPGAWTATVEHIVRRADGGRNGANLAASHFKCNSERHTPEPTETEVRPDPIQLMEPST